MIGALLVDSSTGAQAASLDGPLGKLSITSRVDVIGNRCGKLAYSWYGWDSDLNYLDSWMVILYRGGPDLEPYDKGYNAIDNASGTSPRVRGVDDDPEFSGSIPVCGKVDSTKPVSLWGQWSDGYGEPPTHEATMPTQYVVDYHPVTIKVTTSKKSVKARVLKDGKPWSGQLLKVTGLGRKLRTDAKGVVRIKRTEKTKGKRAGFDLSDIAKSKRVKL